MDARVGEGRLESDERGPRTVKEVQKAAREAGHDVSYKTFQRARQRIGALAHRAEYGGEYVWSLPGVEPLVVTPKEVSTKGAPERVPDSVRVQAREYAIGHPDCSRDDIIGFLGYGVLVEVANAAIDQIAESEERFAGLRQEVPA